MNKAPRKYFRGAVSFSLGLAAHHGRAILRALVDAGAVIFLNQTATEALVLVGGGGKNGCGESREQKRGCGNEGYSVFHVFLRFLVCCLCFSIASGEGKEGAGSRTLGKGSGHSDAL